jgi:hypothetical protein
MLDLCILKWTYRASQLIVLLSQKDDLGIGARLAFAPSRPIRNWRARLTSHHSYKDEKRHFQAQQNE